MKNWLVLILSIIVLGGCMSTEGYIGETQDGQRQGYGTYTDNQGHAYSGYWNDGKLEGIVTINYYEHLPREYVGEVFYTPEKLELYTPHGQGTFTYTNNRVKSIEATFDKDNHAFWEGKITLDTGDIFVGTMGSKDEFHQRFTGKHISSTGEETKVAFENEAALDAFLNQKEEESAREIIFTALFDRCSDFGWLSEDDISACIKQEAYRDFQMQQQQYEMRQLEERLAYSYSSEPEPTFLDLLNQYAQIKQTQQMQKDIQRLKSANRSMRSKQNTQRALKFLYQGRGN